MADIYISLFDSLVKDSKAVEMIRQSGIISGIEISSFLSHFDPIKNAGLKCAAHDPQVFEMNNLGDPEWLQTFDSGVGKRVIEMVRKSDSPVVAFHCGFSAQKVYKMCAYPEAPVESTLYENREDLLSMITMNILGFERLLNHTVSSDSKKLVLLEPMDYSRDKPVNWSVQSDEVKARQHEIEQVFKKYGTNASLRWVTDISFIGDFFKGLSLTEGEAIGFLFDIGHVFITADTKINKGLYSGSIEDYFNELIEIVGDKIYQIHVNVPEGNPEIGYSDSHLPFTKGDSLSDRILRLTRMVIKKSSNLKIFTLEIRGSRDISASEFVRLMIWQASLILNGKE
jgi:hypothetical protein